LRAGEDKIARIGRKRARELGEQDIGHEFSSDSEGSEYQEGDSEGSNYQECGSDDNETEPHTYLTESGEESSDDNVSSGSTGEEKSEFSEESDCEYRDEVNSCV